MIKMPLQLKELKELKELEELEELKPFPAEWHYTQEEVNKLIIEERKEKW